MASSTVNSPDRGAASSSKLSPPSHRIEELKIPVPWGHIAAKAWNDPCGTPVIALHGYQDNAGTFNRLIPLLPTSYYYVCVDLPGHGLSSPFPAGFVLDVLDYVTVIPRVAQYFHWKKFILMGHSLGGRLSGFYSGLYPNSVEKLIMLDALAEFTTVEPLNLNMFNTATKTLLSREESKSVPASYAYEEVINRLMTKRMSKISEMVAKELFERSYVPTEKGFTFSGDRRLNEFFPVYSEDQVYAVIKRIDCPILVILTNFLQRHFSAYSIFSKSLAFYKTRPNFNYAYVDSEHDAHSEAAEVVAPIVTKFLLMRKSSL